jgi:hypothetical protein
MYQKIPIHYLWVCDLLVFFKSTFSMCFLPLFNYKVVIVICHMFLDAYESITSA